MGLLSELTSIKEDISDTLTNNKVSRFAYTQQAYEDNDADGVTVYNVNQEQNIPVGTPSVMKVNETVVERGWRARASSITRMLMNHFLGRISYNLNKANDMINSILSNLISYIGQADGLATLDSNGKITRSELPKSDVAVNDTNTLFTAKGAFDYTLGSLTGRDWLCKVFGWAFGKTWRGTNITNGINEIVFSGDIFVAGTETGCWWSTDGKSWTLGTGIDPTFNIKNVVYGNGAWVAYASHNGNYWSEDGKVWSLCNGLDSSLDYTRSLRYANGIWLISISSQDDNKGYWSENGKDWTLCTGLPIDWANYRTLDYFYYANSLWLCTIANAGSYWSLDGKNWSSATSGLTSGTVAQYCYANNIWVAVTNSTSTNCWWSVNGKDWSQGTGGLLTNATTEVVYLNGIWLSGNYWSTNGKDWTQTTTSLSPNVLGKFFYAGGIWFATTTSTPYWSENGKTWTAFTSSTARAYCFGFANGVWLKTDSNGCWWSNDGKTTWTLGGGGSYGNVLLHVKGTWILGTVTGIFWSGLDLLIDQGYFVD